MPFSDNALVQLIEDHRVQDIMSNHFVFVEDDISIFDAILLMQKNQVPELFVGKDLQGILTLQDLIADNSSQNVDQLKLQMERPLKELLPRFPLITIDYDATAEEARNLMKDKNIGRLPVMKKGKMVGVLRTLDILNKFYSQIEQIRDTYAFINDSLHEGICVVDKNGIVLSWSDHSEILYGISKEEILGKNISTHFPTALLLKVLETKQPFVNAFHSPRTDTFINISALPLFSNGKLIGAVSTDRDISEVIYLSQELKTTRDKLTLLESEVQRIQESRTSFKTITGKSPAIREAVDKASQVAHTNSSILISGESGTGKEVFARAIHNASQRSGPFVAINCSAIPENLFESEMFGYVAGAFTGALSRGKIGKMELANGGTLFLDEIGDMPLFMQAKILRALQERQIMRLGDENPINLDIRIISASNKNLMDLVKSEKFREDLLYRLNVVHLTIPPLRQRKEDLYALGTHFMREFCEENSIPVPIINPDVYKVLFSYSWPGNVRELKNTMQYLVLFSENGVVDFSALPGHIANITQDQNARVRDLNLTATKENSEKEAILKALEHCKGNKTQAAKVLGIPRPTLYYKIKRYELDSSS